MSSSAYTLTRPDSPVSAVVFSSPHSGSDYPESLLRASPLDARRIRSSEDAFVDRLFAAAPRFGAPLLAARAPRAYVDLNRGPDELDPALVQGVSRRGLNPRVASGLGVVPRVVAGGQAIYRGKIPMAEAQARLDRYWWPYHRQLQTLLSEAVSRFGEAVLIDCHSMPHEALDGVARGGARRPQVVIGDRFGASASGAVVERVEAAFAAAGLEVTRNAPFAGAYVTQHYGRPSRGQHAVQIEIDRALYMDEARIEPHAGFDDFRRLLEGVIAEIAGIGRAELPLAAE